MDTLSTFANRFKKLREERGLSQSDLAKELNISRGSVSFYENGSRSPDIKVLADICNYFHVSSDWLIGISSVKSPSIEIRAIGAVTGLTEDAINALVKNQHSKFEKNDLVNFTNILLESKHIVFLAKMFKEIKRLYSTLLEDIKSEKLSDDIETAKEKVRIRAELDNDIAAIYGSSVNITRAYKNFEYSLFEIQGLFTNIIENSIGIDKAIMHEALHTDTENLVFEYTVANEMLKDSDQKLVEANTKLIEHVKQCIERGKQDVTITDKDIDFDLEHSPDDLEYWLGDGFRNGDSTKEG
jgi:transcriptional regulator with XRE-family HTH domain